jgi:hypothetical protein
LLQHEQFQTFAKRRLEAVCLATATKYSPTRTFGLREARAALSRMPNAPQLALAMYGLHGDKLQPGEASSELQHLIRLVVQSEG